MGRGGDTVLGGTWALCLHTFDTERSAGMILVVESLLLFHAGGRSGTHGDRECCLQSLPETEAMSQVDRRFLLPWRLAE